MMEKRYITHNSVETQDLGQHIAKDIRDIRVLALHGDLGSGKTTFVQGFAKGLGITKKIISPTFIIMRTYEIKIKNKSKNSKFFYHVDLYRISDERDVEGLGLMEIMKEQDNIIVIEWAEKILDLLPNKRINIYFEYVNDNQRKIKIVSEPYL